MDTMRRCLPLERLVVSFAATAAVRVVCMVRGCELCVLHEKNIQDKRRAQTAVYIRANMHTLQNVLRTKSFCVVDDL